MGLQEKMLNGITKLALPKINRKVRNTIQSEGLDPYQSVIHYDTPLGKIEIFEQSAEAKASINFANLRGLSSLKISDLTFSDVDTHPFSNEDSHAVGNFTITFDHDLTMDIKGDVSASINTFAGKISERESVTAELSNSGSSMKGVASFTLGSIKKLELKDVHLDDLNFKIGKNEVHIDGNLGIFNSFLNNLIDSATGKFEEEMNGHVLTALKMAIQKAFDTALPIKLND